MRKTSRKVYLRDGSRKKESKERRKTDFVAYKCFVERGLKVTKSLESCNKRLRGTGKLMILK